MKSPLKYFGSDNNTANKINSLFPAHDIYLEPFAGSLATLLAHPGNGRQEIVNDLDPNLINFWKVVQYKNLFAMLLTKAKEVKHSEYWWRWMNSVTLGDSFINQALAFMIRYNFSYNGQGLRFAPSKRIRRGIPEYDSRWQTQLIRLTQCHRRLRYTKFFCMDAIDLISQHSNPNTVIYCDPPFVHCTRQGLSGYKFEQPNSWHRRFLLTCKQNSSRIVISGNRCRLYDRELADWRRVDIKQVNSVGGKGRFRIESFWCNYD